MRLLLVEDDSMLANAVCAGLRQAAYVIDWVPSLESARTALRTHDYGAVLLDLGMPDGDGLALITELRASDAMVPVIVLSARDRITERVRALDLGADDYLVKPFDLNELIARIRVTGRRRAGRSTPTIEIGDVHIDPVGRQVRFKQTNVNLSTREFTLLMALVDHRGRVQSREQLEQSLYSWQKEIESNAVEVHIHHLRRKLGAALIETVRGAGYVVR